MLKIHKVDTARQRNSRLHDFASVKDVTPAPGAHEADIGLPAWVLVLEIEKPLKKIAGRQAKRLPKPSGRRYRFVSLLRLGGFKR